MLPDLLPCPAYGYAGIADAGRAAHPVWIDGDSLPDHRTKALATRLLPVCRTNARRIGRNRPLIRGHPQSMIREAIEVYLSFLVHRHALDRAQRVLRSRGKAR
jgi:hypothetical protein